jgi:hypothetical protein
MSWRVTTCRGNAYDGDRETFRRLQAAKRDGDPLRPAVTFEARPARGSSQRERVSIDLAAIDGFYETLPPRESTDAGNA